MQGRLVLLGRVEEGRMCGPQGREDVVRRIGRCRGERTGRGPGYGGFRRAGIGRRRREERRHDGRGAGRRRGQGVGERQHEGLSLLDRQVLRQDEARQLHVGSRREGEGLPRVARQGLLVTSRPGARAVSLARRPNAAAHIAPPLRRGDSLCG
ncbi:hypothetical protein F01_410421 [Burkholderia cenocepacia]|nr:hypothetical protein F01_410421 [Burkholderia cenocepacia]